MEFEWKGPRNRRRSRCRKTVQPDRLTAEAARASLEIWNRVAGYEQRGIKVVSYRCRKCGELHVGLRREVVELVQQIRELNDPKPRCPRRCSS